MAKSYKDLTPKERYDSAIEADKAEWNPGTEIRKLVREKLGMDNENMAKGIELKTGKPSSDKPYELNPEIKKKGGMVKSSASKRADGCCIRGKTRA
jgi:hypothetical protein